MRIYKEGDVIEIDGQKFLVISVYYQGSITIPFPVSLELRGIRDDK